MTTPTALNPLVLNFTGHIPALKNEKVPVTRKSGKPALVSNQTVQTFYKRVQSSGLAQMQRQDFERIAWPNHVAVYAEFWFFVANETNIAASDGDNAYTTLQELLQKAKKNAPYLGVCDDDKQVTCHHVETYAVRDAQQEGARLFVWQMTEDNYNYRAPMWREFFGFHDQYRRAIVNQGEIDFNEVFTLLP